MTRPPSHAGFGDRRLHASANEFPVGPGRRVPDGWYAGGVRGGVVAALDDPSAHLAASGPRVASTHRSGAMTVLTTPSGASSADVEIRPFRVDVPQSQLDDLRRRVEATNWPEAETVTDHSQGVPLAMVQDLARHWLIGLRLAGVRDEAQRIAAVHHRDRRARHPLHPRPFPTRGRAAADLNHGWPGSIIEQLKIIDRLADPTAHGGSATDAFDLVIPSMPGYGFSGKPTGPGGARSGWARVERAHAPPRLRPLRRAGRRLGRVRRRPDGPASARRIARDPH